MSDSPPDPLAPQKQCELHVHMGGCFSVDDVITLAAPYLHDIDWGLFRDAFHAAFGRRPDPVQWFERIAGGDRSAVDEVRRHYVFTEVDGPDFARFQAKFNLLICIFRHYLHAVPGGERRIPRQALERHRAEGVRYVEVRANTMRDDDVEGFRRFHRVNIDAVRDACRDGFEARYVPSLSRATPLASYEQLRRLLDERPEDYDIIPGVDFCYIEEGYPPKAMQPFFERLARDNDADPSRSLQVLYHVGEIYFDKSLESAVRWCHEAAQLGARRLGHCTALGLDPEAAAARRGGAHARESVAERLDQIAWDLQHRKGLEDAGVDVDRRALDAEAEQLRRGDPDGLVHRPYDEARFDQVRRRQDYVLAEIARLGAVIESCPSSNLRLGSVPTPRLHPVHRFLDSEVNLVIGADDPGIFDSPLHEEVDWVARTTDLTAEALASRLGDPRQHRLRRHAGAA